MDSSLGQPRSATARRARLTALQLRFLRGTVRIVFGVLCLLPLVWVLFLAPTTGKGATTFGSAVHDPKDFLITLLNGVTAAGLYFVVASGFTLIFGLMRVVNMAHGAFFLLGGYIALEAAARLGRRGRRLRADERPGQPEELDRAGAGRHASIVGRRRAR